jgi:hypothetical protein
VEVRLDRICTAYYYGRTLPAANIHTEGIEPRARTMTSVNLLLTILPLGETEQNIVLVTSEAGKVLHASLRSMEQRSRENTVQLKLKREGSLACY